jgi:hypothetical protein
MRWLLRPLRVVKKKKVVMLKEVNHTKNEFDRWEFPKDGFVG